MSTAALAIAQRAYSEGYAPPLRISEIADQLRNAPQKELQ
jgi:hypothetical protein